MPNHSAILYEGLKVCSRRHEQSVRTLRRWIKNEGLPSYQVTPGGKILVSCAEVDRFIASRRRPRAALQVLVEETMAELQQRPKRERGKGNEHQKKTRGLGNGGRGPRELLAGGH